jgi:hypothetical protein
LNITLKSLPSSQPTEKLTHLIIIPSESRSRHTLRFICLFHRPRPATMPLDGQGTIALITLVVSCPPTIWLVYTIYAERRTRSGQSKPPFPHVARLISSHLISTVLPIHTHDLSEPASKMTHPRPSRVRTFESYRSVRMVEYVNDEACSYRGMPA